MHLSAKITKFLRSNVSLSVDGIETAMQKYRIYCIASGELDSELKFYFYSLYVRFILYFFN